MVYSSYTHIPEFLRTHSVTTDRLADSYNQTQQYPKKQFTSSLDYQLMRTRARAVTSGNLQEEARRFESEAKESSIANNPVAAKYGLVLTLTRTLQFDRAKRQIDELREQYSLNIPFRIAEAEIYEKAQQPEIARDLLKDALA